MTEQEHRQVVRILADMIGDWQSRETLRRRAVEGLSDEEQTGDINLNRPRESWAAAQCAALVGLPPAGHR